ncbi:MAG: tetratricopeptide repeat protein [Sedimentisphaerales bacterium]|nr:tetratricopeptide repeat protein [Sedimentisphaerales bacterium]
MKYLPAFFLGAVLALGTLVLLELSGDPRDASRQVAVESVPNLDPRAVVVLEYLDRRQAVIGTTKWTRVAFAIGDGTLLLTAAHCVDDFEQSSRHPVSTDIVVISPYYGDVFGFEIVAVDEQADVAILKAPWPAHPALALASEEELAAAKEILIVSRPQAGQVGRIISTELLPVLAPKNPSPNEAVQLKGTKQVAKGWSGSALVIPETGAVAGVVTQRRTRGFSRLRALLGRSAKRDALGCGVGSIHALLRQHGLESVAARRPPKLEPIPDAERGFLLAMDFFEATIKNQAPRLFESAQELARLRPNSTQAHLLAALAATVRAGDPNLSEQELLGQAESSYEKALQADPNSAHAHAVYGNFLMKQGRRDEALAQSEAALELDPNDRLALLNRLSLLPFSQTKETVERLIRIDPNDPYYWFHYSNSLLHLNERQAALEAAQRAVDLDPNGLFYGGLANALSVLGRLDEAETYYKLMTERCKCQQCWYNYAAFLAAHRPDDLKAALHALSMAEAKASMRKIPQKSMNALKLQLLEKTAPAQAETFARQLLDAAPGEALYWSHLAAILRAQEQFAEAVEAAAKAVELDPNGPYRPRLANCLAKAGDLNAAQRVYDEMLDRHPERPRYWYWYAQYLADYCPDRIDEALSALDESDSRPDADPAWSVPAADLAKLRTRLDAGAAVAQ